MTQQWSRTYSKWQPRPCLIDQKKKVINGMRARYRYVRVSDRGSPWILAIRAGLGLKCILHFISWFGTPRGPLDASYSQAKIPQNIQHA